MLYGVNRTFGVGTPIADWLLLSSPVLILIGSIYYLTRPKVKEQFK